MATDNKKEKERDELHRAIWAIADELRGAVDGWDLEGDLRETERGHHSGVAAKIRRLLRQAHRGCCCCLAPISNYKEARRNYHA